MHVPNNARHSEYAPIGELHLITRDYMVVVLHRRNVSDRREMYNRCSMCLPRVNPL